MKNAHIYILNGEPILIDAPTEPFYQTYGRDDQYYDDMEKYNKALQEAIKNGVKFKDADMVNTLVRRAAMQAYNPKVNCGNEVNCLKLENGQMFPIPEGYSVRVEYERREIISGLLGEVKWVESNEAQFNSARGGEFEEFTRKLAILENQEPTNSVMTYTKDDVYGIIHDFAGWFINDTTKDPEEWINENL